jgi:hypothetical protein
VPETRTESAQPRPGSASSSHNAAAQADDARHDMPSPSTTSRATSHLPDTCCAFRSPADHRWVHPPDRGMNMRVHGIPAPIVRLPGGSATSMRGPSTMARRLALGVRRSCRSSRHACSTTNAGRHKRARRPGSVAVRARSSWAGSCVWQPSSPWSHAMAEPQQSPADRCPRRRPRRGGPGRIRGLTGRLIPQMHDLRDQAVSAYRTRPLYPVAAVPSPRVTRGRARPPACPR